MLKKFCSLLALGSAAALLGCGVEGNQSEDVEVVDSAIIGGSSVSVSSRRSLGLIDVGNGCSASAISPHWVITATHCVDMKSPISNRFFAPRPDGTLEERRGAAISQVGASDISLVLLQPNAAGSTWPTLIRQVHPTAPSAMVGQSIACFGQGATAYASPSGLTGGLQWRTVIKSVAQFNGIDLFVNAVNGNHIQAPGDSGGPCTFNNQIVGVNSHLGSGVCADPTNNDTCKATLTRIDSIAVRSAHEFANYINYAPTRGADVATFSLLTLEPGWINYPTSTHNAGISVSNGMLRLRGAIQSTSTSQFAFKLPLGFEPAHTVYAPIDLCAGAKGRLEILTNGEVRVHAEGSVWSNAQCLVWLDGVSFPLFTNASIPLTLENGWISSQYTARAPGVRKTGAGIVHLDGAMRNGSTGTAFTLPEGYRPTGDVYVPVDLCNATKGRLFIRSNGQASVQTEGSFSQAQCFTSLEGAWFAIDSSGFSALTPLNGWYGAPFPFGRNPAVANYGGMIRFQGSVATDGTNTHVFTLPNHLRPSAVASIPIDMCSNKKGRLVVAVDGRVFIQSFGDWAASRCFVSLDGVSFGI